MILTLLSAVADLAPGHDVGPCGPVAEASSLCQRVHRITGNTVLAGLSDTLVVLPAKIALILAVAYVVRRLLFGLVGHLVSGRARRVDTVAVLFRSVVSTAVWTVAVFMALAELGLHLGPLIAGAGIVGVAVGFGAKNLVRDFLSGMFMLVEDQYGVGDIIDAGPAVGTVESVGLRSTRLRDVNGTVWHVPNGHIKRVGNRSQQWARVVLDVAVSYRTDIGHATEVIRRTADTMGQDAEFSMSILGEPEVWGVEDLGVDGVAIRVVLKTAPNDQFRVIRALRGRIKGAFDDAGIEIPLPQRTIWHRSPDRPVAAAPRTDRE